RYAPEHAPPPAACRFVPWRGSLWVLRELGGAAAPVRLEPGTELVWDRRFAVAVPRAAMPGLALGYLGQRGIIGNRTPLADREGRDLPRLVYPVLPALWDEAGVVAVPHLGYSRPGAATLPTLAFRPLNPLSLAGVTVV